MKLHLVYVKGNSISTPFAVTNELSERLSKRVDLIVYDWTESGTISPESGDILIGHPYPYPGRIFENSFYQKGWAKKFLLCPFTHAMPHYISFLDKFIDDCDAYLAITGEYWFDTLPSSICSHWAYKMIRIDLGINLNYFPFIKTEFNKPSKRKFLYIGRNADYKGIDYLIDIAKRNPNIEIGWIGDTGYYGDEIKRHGAIDFSTKEGLSLVKEYDFLLTCGRADANPTTILEAAAWGLVVICTPQSGYCATPWITNIPLDNLDRASKIIINMANESEENIKKLQQQGREELAVRFSWDKFENTVWETIVGIKFPYSKNSVSPEQKKRNRKILLRSYRNSLLKGYTRHIIDRVYRVAKRLSIVR